MRALSNYFTVGDLSSSSSKVKLHNRLVSQKALDLTTKLTRIEWCRVTINEHPLPLKILWRNILDCEQISVERIADLFSAHKMVTITKDEDKRLREKGFNSSGAPEERYAICGIIVRELENAPRTLFS